MASCMGVKHIQSFHEAKERLSQLAVFALVNFNQAFEVKTDAPVLGIGVVLSHNEKPN